eukprot:scaffold356039_cov17-Prasinocladus_malaysianus.AAC.1
MTLFQTASATRPTALSGSSAASVRGHRPRAVSFRNNFFRSAQPPQRFSPSTANAAFPTTTSYQRPLNSRGIGC